MRCGRIQNGFLSQDCHSIITTIIYAVVVIPLGCSLHLSTYLMMRLALLFALIVSAVSQSTTAAASTTAPQLVTTTPTTSSTTTPAGPVGTTVAISTTTETSVPVTIVTGVPETTTVDPTTANPTSSAESAAISSVVAAALLMMSAWTNEDYFSSWLSSVHVWNTRVLNLSCFVQCWDIWVRSHTRIRVEMIPKFHPKSHSETNTFYWPCACLPSSPTTVNFVYK